MSTTQIQDATLFRVSEIVGEVLIVHEGKIGTHYDGCWKYHVACLAVLIQDVVDGK